MHKSLIILSLCLPITGCANIDKIANPEAKSDFQLHQENLAHMAENMPEATPTTAIDIPPAVEVATLLDVRPLETIAPCVPTFREWACIGGVRKEWAWGNPGFHNE